MRALFITLVITMSHAVHAGTPTPRPLTTENVYHVNSIVSDGTNVYFSDRGADGNNKGGIKMAPITGGPSAPKTLVPSDDPQGLSIVGSTIYYSDYPNSGPGLINSVSTSGGAPTAVFGNQQMPGAMLVLNNTVYWTVMGTLSAGSPTNGSIMAGVPGGAPVSIAVNQNFDFPNDLIAQGNSIYWRTSETTIWELDLSAGPSATPKVLAQGSPDDVASIAINSMYLYWTEMVAGTLNAVSLKDGSKTVLATNQSLYYVVADKSSVYWFNGGALMKLTVKGGTPVVLASGLHPADTPFIVDSTNIYWAEAVTSDVSNIYTIPKN